VITISLLVASLKYRERSSLTFASATLLGWGSLFREPGFGLLLRDDGEDLDDFGDDVIERRNFTNSKSILRLIETAQALDSTLADLAWLVPQVELDGISDSRSEIGPESSQALRRPGERTIANRFGQIIARTSQPDRRLPFEKGPSMAPRISERGRAAAKSRDQYRG
jgi:hypothetical protein